MAYALIKMAGLRVSKTIFLILVALAFQEYQFKVLDKTYLKQFPKPDFINREQAIVTQ